MSGRLRARWPVVCAGSSAGSVLALWLHARCTCQVVIGGRPEALWLHALHCVRTEYSCHGAGRQAPRPALPAPHLPAFDVPPCSWHSLKKLSLENGDDADVVREALAWQMHRRAAAPGHTYSLYPELAAGTPYPVNVASFVAITVHLLELVNVTAVDGSVSISWQETSEFQGVYVSVEDMDKQALRNKKLWLDRWGAHEPA